MTSEILSVIEMFSELNEILRCLIKEKRGGNGNIMRETFSGFEVRRVLSLEDASTLESPEETSTLESTAEMSTSDSTGEASTSDSNAETSKANSPGGKSINTSIDSQRTLHHNFRFTFPSHHQFKFLQIIKSGESISNTFPLLFPSSCLIIAFYSEFKLIVCKTRNQVSRSASQASSRKESECSSQLQKIIGLHRSVYYSVFIQF
jgi:hypothetical protein